MSRKITPKKMKNTNVDQLLIKKFKEKDERGPDISCARFDHFMKLIDSNLARCLVLGVSRLSTEWGMFSSKMNRETRKYGCELSTKLFTYWTLSSQVLEAKYRGVGVISKRKELREFKREIQRELNG